MKKYQKGFTLIELLVVIAIIAVLTGIGLASFQGAQAKARDAERKADLKALQTALQAFYNDNQKFPDWATVVQNPPCNSYNSYGSSFVVNWDNPGSPCGSLTPNYIKQIPEDPIGAGGNQYYYCALTTTTDNGQSYTLFANLENANDPEALATKPEPVVGTTCTSSSGCVTATINTGSYCSGYTFNYWINNP